jgi:Flp pilus assembly protein TadD
VQAFLGLYYQRQGLTAEAVRHFGLAAALEPENAAWQAALAEAYTQDGNLPLALEAHQRATQIAPREAQYWRRLAAFCAIYEYQISEIGLPAARRALELAPEDASALDVMGQIYLALGNRPLAEKYFQQALKADPNLAEAHLHLGLVYLQSGQMALARQALQRSAELAAGSPLEEQAQMLLRQYFP